ncbi:MAG: DUF1552 domain-containing protein [Gammaproteobacteria bacterium]
MNFITKKHIPRRTFLRGMGTTLALPFLESMLPAASSLAQAQTTLTPTRFTGIFVPHGAAPGYWVPETEGRDFVFPYIYRALEPFRDQVVVTSGLWSKSAESPPGVTGADHFVAAAFLCANKPKKTTAEDIYVGTTIDQMIAQKIGQETLLPSLQLAVEDPGAQSACGEGYSCAYTNSISWQAPSRPLPMEINPQVVFERLFGDGGTPEERDARKRTQGSILDSVTGSLKRFGASLGPNDRARLEQYAEDVREIERRLQIAAKASAETPDFPVPYGVPESFDDHIRVQFDLISLAFQADITRVSSLLYARDLTSRVYPESGTDVSFHGGSHHAGEPGRIAEYAKINQYHVSTLAYFVEKLRSVPDGDGTLLDHSLVLYGTNMGDSNQHLHYDVPHVLIGNASGRMEGNRHLAYPTLEVPTGNLLLSILDVFGIHRESIGDSTGRLENLFS